MNLVFQGEVKGDVFYLLLDKNLGARGVLLLLQVFDHVGEPHRQTIVAGRQRKILSQFTSKRKGKKEPVTLYGYT